MALAADLNEILGMDCRVSLRGMPEVDVHPDRAWELTVRRDVDGMFRTTVGANPETLVSDAIDWLDERGCDEEAEVDDTS